MVVLLRSTCPSCRTWKSVLSQRHSFSSSCIKQNIPPESPHFVDIPQTIQPETFLKRPIKGILPVPREIFPLRKPDKNTPEFINRATPDKSNHNRDLQQLHLSEREDFKDRLAAMRKRHLREGLTELHHRKQSMTKRVSDRSRDKTVERSRLLSQAEREDDRLTGSTIVPDIFPGFRTDTSSIRATAEASMAQKRINVETQQNLNQEERQDALHTLYVNAQKFITTEGQLNETVNRLFPDGENEAFSDGSKPGHSLWNKGLQPTVQGLVNRQKRSTNPKSAQRAAWGETQTLHEERLTRIAEELSGGKIPE